MSADARGRVPLAARRAGAAVVAGALLTGCGISATDPVEAGDPAVIGLPLAPENWSMVFLRSPSGRLVPVFRARTWGELPPKPPVLVAEAVEALFEGPTPEERATGLTSTPLRLPPDRPVRVSVDGEFALTVRLPLALDALDGTALRQVVCTAALAHERRGWTQITLAGTDGTMEATPCDAAIDIVPSTVRPSLAPPRPEELTPNEWTS
ncbi:hypothetical protein ABZX40_31770 [Streptomyces sp. NPDC004610]|uniref:hypothetical protein n=1 Tax=unclassified Streptomyces TaxID=2593676 RepID=UPI0033B505D5